MKIEFYTKDIYGKSNLYIKNPEIARNIRILTGKKTVDGHDLAALINLGHAVVEVLPPRQDPYLPGIIAEEPEKSF